MDHDAYPCKGMDSKLYRASGWGDTKLLDQVLEECTVDIFQEVTPARDTALHRAAFYGHAKLASKLILKASENPEGGMQFLKAHNTDGNTALHAAAEGGCEEIVEELVKKDSDVACVKNKAGETALFKASEKGHVGIVEYLLNHTPEEHDARADGQTPLHVAVSKLRTGVTAKLLKKRPALIRTADIWDRTALHILALSPQINEGTQIKKIGEMLLKKEISLMYRVDANWQSALHLGAKVGNASLVKVILSYGPDCTEILDKDGRTALHLAVENALQAYETCGQYSLREIISSLAQPRLINCSDKSGQTALDIAIQKTKEDKQLFLAIIRYLESQGACQKILGREDSPLREGFGLSTGLKSNWNKEIISVNAVLIATVAFAAAFTLPGNIDPNANPPVPFLLNVSLFKIFILCDSFAFCNSVGSAVLLIFALYGNQGEDPFLVNLCNIGLWVAMTSIALAFGAAIHLVVAHKCMWLAVLVWIMVCFLPIGVRLQSMRGKLFMFVEPKTMLVKLFEDAIHLTAVLCLPLLQLFAESVWSVLIVSPCRKVVRMLSQT